MSETLTHHRRAALGLAALLLLSLPAAALVAQAIPAAQGGTALVTYHSVPPAPWYSGPTPPERTEAVTVPIDATGGVAPMASPTAATGTAKVLALALEFTDVKHASGNTIASIDGKLTGGNSLKSYFQEVSYSKLDIAGNAYGWYSSAQAMAYYGAPANGYSGDSHNFYKIVEEAVQLADSQVDFSQYDTNGDRLIDNIILVHAGQDEAVGGGANAIWSKQSYYPGTLRVDGVYVGFFMTVSEYSPMGVYAHEFGHMIGLPDLYDIDYTSDGVGAWDLMASGSWGNWGSTPAAPSAWCKVYLGWITPVTVANYAEGLQLGMVEGAEAKVVKVPTMSSSEYFLLENREQSGYDRFLPGSGLLIWHIDGAQISRYFGYNAVNMDETHKGVDLEEASGTQNLDVQDGNDGDSGDPWASDPLGFTPTSSPNTNLYDGTDTKIRIFNISSPGTVMTIDIDFGGDSFAISMDTDMPIRESSPGETITYNVTVGTRSSLGDTLTLTVVGPQAAWGSIPTALRTITLGPKGTWTVPLKVTPPAGTAMGARGVVVLRAQSQTVGSIQSELLTTTIVRQVHVLRSSPADASVRVVPGTPRVVDLSIANLGNGAENVTLSLDAARSYWGSISPKKVTLAVGATQTARATFNVPLDVLEGETEQFELVLFVEILGGSFEGGEGITLKPTLEVPIGMTVDRVVALRWGNVQAQSVLPGGTASFELTLYNEGNHEASVSVAAQVPVGWQVAFQDGGALAIPAFQAKTFTATVTASPDALAGTVVRINSSATEDFHFFYATMQLTVLQLHGTTLAGPSAVFADPGARIEFPLNVTNTGNGADRVTLEVSNGGLWTVTLDESFLDLGTDARRRTAPFTVIVGAPTAAEAYEEGLFTVQVKSGNGAVTSQIELSVTINPVSSFTSELEVGTDSITPTGKAIYWVTVKNTGNLEDLYHIGVSGLPDGWSSTLESRFFSVAAGKTKTVELDVAPRPGTTAVAGAYHLVAQVASELGGGLAIDLPLTVTIQGTRGFTVGTMEPSYVGPSGARVHFRVMVRNVGNVRETVTLSGVGDFEGISFDTPVVPLEPYGSRVVNVTLELPSTKDDQALDVRVVAISQDNTKQESVVVPVTVRAQEGLPGPSAMAAIVAVAAVSAVAAGVERRRRA